MNASEERDRVEMQDAEPGRTAKAPFRSICASFSSECLWCVFCVEELPEVTHDADRDRVQDVERESDLVLVNAGGANPEQKSLLLRASLYAEKCRFTSTCASCPVERLCWCDEAG